MTLVRRIYEDHNPHKLLGTRFMAETMAEHEGREQALVEELCRVYDIHEVKTDEQKEEERQEAERQAGAFGADSEGGAPAGSGWKAVKQKKKRGWFARKRS